ncbi:transient receptor potential cation channel subfamily M member 3-like [Glandiceps talaboti]
MAQRGWIEKTFNKKECAKFIGQVGELRRCGCGRLFGNHAHLTQTTHLRAPSTEKWNTDKHTVSSPTDSYGFLEFQGAGQANKAQYIRLSGDTPPDAILQLLQKEWKLELPKLVISIHGGIQNFDLQPKLARVFRKGLQKAAKTTGAWVLTGGTNTGLTVHVGDALNNRSVTMRGRTVTIGIAPWGVLLNRDNLCGRDVVQPYYTVPCPTSKGAILNSSHTHFLLVDNGTVGTYGAEIMLRRRLEKYISQQRISLRSRRCVPVVCVVVEGGPNTIRSVLTMVSDMPPIPIVVCDGSGRAADLLAFVHKFAGDDGTMLDTLRDQLLVIIQQTFLFTREQAERLFVELMLCVRRRDLITVFRLGDNESEDIDLAILTALLKSQNSSPVDQLQLALAWDREDIAKKQVFVYGVEWPEGALEQAMMDALTFDRVEFVKLLMDNGVNMQRFLTFARLEDLFNTVGPTSTLHYLARDLQKSVNNHQSYTLVDIGFVVEHLMGGAYRSLYTKKKFRSIYQNSLRNQTVRVSYPNYVNITLYFQIPQAALSHVSLADPTEIRVNRKTETFTYPFHELMVWAVLMKRHKMALFMWQHGEEALAKALAASKLYKAMAHDAEQDEIEVDTAEELRAHSSEFQNLALHLLDQCYHCNNLVTQQLLTYELKNWSKLTCLSLAVAANHKEFIAHPCCQTLLNDMWMGGLQMRKNTSLKVIMGILLPPSIVTLEFKSKEELELMPQTIEEHFQDLQDADDKSSVHDEEMEMEDLLNEEGSKAMSSGIVNVGQKAAIILGVQNDGGDKEAIKKSSLKLGKKIYEFYNAPVSKFWSHTMAYIVFLVIFNYVVLVHMDSMPHWQEWYIIAYVVTFAVEKVRELFITETGGSFGTKLKVFYNDYWNIVDTLAIAFFIAGVVLRFIPTTLAQSKVVYCVAIIFWYIRLLDLFSVNKYLGPYVTMMSKMVIDMLYICVILTVILMSFGVARQAIKHPNEQFYWTSVKKIFLEPYFMLYGEVYAPDIDPPCTEDDPLAPQCSTGHWITPLIMTIYLLVANILLINLLIAVFNNTFAAVNAISRQVWKFQRYRLVMEYEQMAVLSPPIIIISHSYMFIRYLFRRCRKFRPTTLDKGLKLFLSDDDVEKLFDFEEECMEHYFRDTEDKRRCCNEVMVTETHERTEAMELKLEEVNEKNNRTRLSLQNMDQRLVRLEEVAVQTMSAVQSIQLLMQEQTSRTLQIMTLAFDQSEINNAVEVAMTAQSTTQPGQSTVIATQSGVNMQQGQVNRSDVVPTHSSSTKHKTDNPAKVVTGECSGKTTSADSDDTPTMKQMEKDDTVKKDEEKRSELVRLPTMKSKLERQQTVQSDQTLSPEDREPVKPTNSRKHCSTFVRWASMQESAHSFDSHSSSDDDDDFRPPRRQISKFGPNIPSTTLPRVRTPYESDRPSTSRGGYSNLGRQMLLNTTTAGLMPRQTDSRRSSDSTMSQFSYSHEEMGRLQIPTPKPYTSIPTYSSITDAIDTSIMDGLPSNSRDTRHPFYNTITDSIDTTGSERPSPPVSPAYRSKSPEYDIDRYSSRYMIHRFSQDESAHLKMAEQRDYDLMENEVHDTIHQYKSDNSTEIPTQGQNQVEFKIGGKKLVKRSKNNSQS